MIRRRKRGTLNPSNSSILLDLRSVLTARGISQPKAFLLKIGINTNSAHKMLKGKSVQVNMKQLTALCLNLNCTPNELFVVRDMQLPEHHALRNLEVYEERIDEQSVKEWLSGKSVEEVRELMKK